jgi:protein involved in polysaccharide export with SLBB domain
MFVSKNYVKFLILIILAQAVAFSQIMPNLTDGYMSSEMQMSGSTQLSMEERYYIQQMMAKERSLGKGASALLQKDTFSLFPDTDTALGKPLVPRDTMSYILVEDTLFLDSLEFYNDIEELRKLTPDGKKRIVLRRKKVPRSVLGLRRYESTFFESANPPIFSNVTSGIDGNYPLKPGDELILTVWGAVEKESRLKINYQGRINVESIGLVSLNGTTLAEAEGILKAKLSKVYSGIGKGQTFVNLRMETLSPVKIFLLGEVGKPGAYTFHGNTTVFQALYMAEGPSKEGSVRSVQIARADSTFKVDLYDYLMHGKNVKGATLFDGDIVFLPRAKILAEVDGSVGRPAIYELKEGEGVKQLISFAGGINPDAAEQSMVLKRIYPNGRKDYETILKPSDYIEGKDSLALRNGDALMVFKSTEETMFNATILGAIKYPGTYQFKDSMDAANLVEISGGLQEVGYTGRIHVLRAIPQGGYKLLSQNLIGEKSIPLEPRDTLVVYSLRDMFKPDSVSIGGAVSKPGYYQYYGGMDAKDLVLLAGGYLTSYKAGSLFINRLNSDGRTITKTMHSVPYGYDKFDDPKIRLRAWDHVEIPYDSNFYRPELVVLSGAFRNPGTYTLKQQDETLESVINRAGGFTPEAYLDGAQFFRRSIMIIPKDTNQRDSTFGRVGVDISKVLKRERRNNITLLDGDSIHIPPRAISVRVHGHVGLVTNVLWRKGEKAEWYVNQAGGVSVTGDKERVMIKYANGSVALASQAERPPDPGSEIIVPYRRPPDPVVWTQVVAAIGTIAGAISTILLAYVAFK